MSRAADAFRECLERADISDAACPVWNALDIRPIQKSGEIRDQLARQIDHPVNWLGLMQHLRQDFQSAIWIELAPGKTLTGLLLDIDRTALIFRSETQVQIRRLQDRIVQWEGQAS
jgi:[acyl-carrier-protein] S-malonyltransferase